MLTPVEKVVFEDCSREATVFQHTLRDAPRMPWQLRRQLTKSDPLPPVYMDEAWP